MNRGAFASALEALTTARNPSPSQRFERGESRVLGGGHYGEVRADPRSPGVAVKRVQGRTHWGLEQTDDPAGPPLQRIGAQGEADMQALLGNQYTETGEHIGVMPPLRAVESVVRGEPDDQGRRTGWAYYEMPNLQQQGYTTLRDLDAGEAEVAQLMAESALNRAWAARAGVVASDATTENAMALKPGVRSPQPDGSRTLLIDAGLFRRGAGELDLLTQQVNNIAQGYDVLGLPHLGGQIQQAVLDTAQNEGLAVARHMVAGALSDLAARQQGLTLAELQKNRALTESKLRMAGEALSPAPWRQAGTNTMAWREFDDDMRFSGPGGALEAGAPLVPRRQQV
jgi:hypothetical protein